MHKITYLQADALYQTLYGESKRTDLTVLKDIFSAAWSTKDGEYLCFRTVYARAAKLLTAIADKKPFPAHNRAMAVMCALSLLELNGITLSATEEHIKEMLSFPSTESGIAALGEWLEATSE